MSSLRSPMVPVPEEYRVEFAGVIDGKELYKVFDAHSTQVAIVERDKAAGLGKIFWSEASKP